MAVPYTFGTATASIPLSQLDSNFATTITLGNTAIQLGNTVTTLNNMTLANVTVSSGNVTFTNVSATTANVTTANITTAVIGTATITTAGITTANVTTANVTTGIITTANVTTGNVATLVTTSVTNSGLTTGRVVYTSTGGLETSSANLLYSGTDLTVYGLTVGRGLGAVATNTAVGTSALSANTSGATNVAIGYQAGKLNTTGSNNVSIGVNALINLLTGANNVGVGRDALSSVTSSNNTAIGYNSGASITTGGKNVILGSYTGQDAPISNSGSNYIVLSDGDGNVRQTIDSSGNVGIGTTSPTAGYKLSLATGGIRISGTQASAGATGAIDTQAYSMANSSFQYLGYFLNSGLGGSAVSEQYAGIFKCATEASAYTVTDLTAISVFTPTKGAGSTVTSASAIVIRDQTVGASNYGLVSQITSGSNKWNIYASGTAANYFNGSVGIGTSTPNASAILDAQSTTQGVRMPNMTTTQKNAISSPAAGLMVFDTTLAKLCVYSGSAWQTITSV